MPQCARVACRVTTAAKEQPNVQKECRPAQQEARPELQNGLLAGVGLSAWYMRESTKASEWSYLFKRFPERDDSSSCVGEAKHYMLAASNALFAATHGMKKVKMGK